eukprot:COSAG06_NODE_5392_length_3506_cov_1.770968_7_plen_76_part_00
MATTEEETWAQEKKELLANRRKLAEYCTTLLERVEVRIEKRHFLRCHLYIKVMFYQDRLGTNIGKTQKRVALFAG